MNEPVAWMVTVENDTEFFIDEKLSKKHAIFHKVDAIPVYTHPAKTLTDEDAKEKLIRIMGTFDLATGHADTFDELLDSLEVELRDVLGYYREALIKAQE